LWFLKLLEKFKFRSNLQKDALAGCLQVFIGKLNKLLKSDGRLYWSRNWKLFCPRRASLLMHQKMVWC
jgi:hypothetical protein